MRRIPVIALIVLTLSLPIPALAQSATPAASSPSAASGDFAGLVDIGGRSLYLECHGTGSPTVILEAGYRASGRFWSDDLLQPDAPRTMVLPGVAEFTRVCAYDRPGTVASIGEDDFISRSDPIAQPRTAPEVVAELHALLQAAEVPGPYVLAGHSLGGFFARLYAATYPDEVVGLVLVDAYSEQTETLMTPEQWEAMGQLSRELGSDTVVPIPGYGDLETIGFGRGQRGGARGGGGLAAAADAAGGPGPRQADHRAGRDAGVHHRRVGSAPAGELRRPGRPRASGALHRGHRERPRHPPGSTRAGDRSDSAGGRGRAQPGHLVRPDFLLRGMTGS